MLLARPAIAQAGFPSRPVRVVIGFPPGGGIDILARLIAPKMSERLGQPVVVENRPGANGLIATQGVLQADADGHTMLFGTTGNLAVNPSLYVGKPGMDMEKDFAPLSHVASLGFVLVVNPAVQANSLKDLIELAKAKPAVLPPPKTPPHSPPPPPPSPPPPPPPPPPRLPRPGRIGITDVSVRCPAGCTANAWLTERGAVNGPVSKPQEAGGEHDNDG